jgi:hypothetical protein
MRQLTFKRHRFPPDISRFDDGRGNSKGSRQLAQRNVSSPSSLRPTTPSITSATSSNGPW